MVTMPVILFISAIIIAIIFILYNNSHKLMIIITKIALAVCLVLLAIFIIVLIQKGYKSYEIKTNIVTVVTVVGIPLSILIGFIHKRFVDNISNKDNKEE